MADHATDHWRGAHYEADHITGPVAFLNPTTRFLSVQGQRRRQQQQPQPQPQTQPQHHHHHHHHHHRHDGHGDHDDKDASGGTTPPKGSHPGSSSSGIYTVWRSRDNRKGRHTLALTPSAAAASTSTSTSTSISTPIPTANDTTPRRRLLAGLARMALRHPLHDVSYDVALVFTLGSLVWVLNGFFVLLPLLPSQRPDATTFPGESAWGGGVTAVVGATVFELGSVLLMLEAVNEDRAGCFGWALRRGEEDLLASLLAQLEQHRDGARAACRHHHADGRHWLRSGVEEEEEQGVGDGDRDGDGPGTVAGAGGGRRWTWWPSWYELRTHYLRDIGFLACLSQMFGATVFWISGFTGLPPILDVLSLPAENGIYWLPQVVGGSGFIVSSWLFMLETQKRWYLPAPTVLGWHIGLWNLVGAIGFTLCGALGFASSSSDACELALTWSTFIGSWAFLIGSVIQWYESLDKYPVMTDKNLPASRTVEELVEKEDGQA